MTGGKGNRGGGSWAAMGVAMVLPSLVTLLYFVLLAGTHESLQQAAYALAKCVQFAFPVVWVGLICRERLGWPILRAKGLAGGFGFGMLVAIATVVLYRHVLQPLDVFASAAGEVRAKVAELGIDSLLRYAAVGIFYSLCHSLLEEYYWRWFVFGSLRRLLPLWPAVGLSSFAFTMHHVILLATYFGWGSFWTWSLSLAVAVGGAYWAWLYHRSGSLYGPWLSHLLVDAAIFLVGYDLVHDLLAR